MPVHDSLQATAAARSQSGADREPTRCLTAARAVRPAMTVNCEPGSGSIVCWSGVCRPDRSSFLGLKTPWGSSRGLPLDRPVHTKAPGSLQLRSAATLVVDKSDLQCSRHLLASVLVVADPNSYLDLLAKVEPSAIHEAQRYLPIASKNGGEG
jgi:hypothetical protein